MDPYNFNKCLALALSTMILGQAYLVRSRVGTWLCPACLFGLFWFAYTFFPLAILFWVPVDPYAIAFILLCTVAFSLGSFPFGWKKAFERNTEKCETAASMYSSRFLWRVFYVIILTALVSLFLDLFAQGFTLRDLILDLYGSAATYANLRYSEDLHHRIFGLVATVCAYLGAILGGLLFRFRPTRAERGFLMVLSLLPSALTGITQSANMPLMLSIAFFYAGLLVHRISVGPLRLFEKGSVKRLALLAAVLIAIITISFESRSGMNKIEENEVFYKTLTTRFASYTCGHIYAFSDWFAFLTGRHSTFTYAHEGTSYGFYTFIDLFQRMGSHKVVPPGVYDEYYIYDDWLTSNIYTMFRGLILDFGFTGSVFFMLGTGFLLHWAFHRMLLNKRPVFTVAVFVFMICYFYLSFVISALVWLNIYLAFVFLWTVLHINERMTQRVTGQLRTVQLTAGMMP